MAISKSISGFRHLDRHAGTLPRAATEGIPDGAEKTAADYVREVRITVAMICFTLFAWMATTWDTVDILWRRVQLGDTAGAWEQALFIALTQFLLYGNFIYQFTRLGYLRRRLAHRPLAPEAREALYDGDAPSLAILVPSYKEDPAVVRRTLLSAALQDYPSRRVVLLIDDPPDPSDEAARAELEATRRLPAEVQAALDSAAERFTYARNAFLVRSIGPLWPDFEAEMLARLYELAAMWIDAMASRYPVDDHADRLFVDAVLHRAARSHRERAARLRATRSGEALSRDRIEREYRRLAALFRVEVTSFERKRFVNLSHEPNKAMNLNGYIGLLGQRWHEELRGDGLHLEPGSLGGVSLDVPAAQFLITLDADSVLVPEYALVLINEMLRAGGERIAVAQTPYNTMPNPPGLLERVAGATTDIQYLIHQGFTRFDATFWVGANALLRVAALQDIKEIKNERGFEVPVFVQDGTVIEDTESSVDLIARGWKLFNYPERLAYSATPPDFGSLLIQRRRWANGGLIILPKLLRYLIARPHRASKLRECFFRIHYLSSLAVVNIGLLILLGLSFDQSVDSIWLPLTALPYFLLYGRDLRYSGYPIGDLVRVYALNLLLIPVHLGGVFKSLQQAITGRRIPFCRTPKVSGRTAAPAGYVLAGYVLVLGGLIGFGIDLAAERWVSAAFCMANTVMLAYAIKSFIGFRQSWEDIGLARRSRLPAASPALGDTASALLAPPIEVPAAIPVLAPLAGWENHSIRGEPSWEAANESEAGDLQESRRGRKIRLWRRKP